MHIKSPNMKKDFIRGMRATEIIALPIFLFSFVEVLDTESQTVIRCLQEYPNEKTMTSTHLTKCKRYPS